MASILGWFAISSSSVSYFVRTLCYDPSILGGPAWHGSQLHWVTQAPSPWQVIHEGEKCWRDQEKIERIRERWRWSPSVVSSSLQPHGLEPIRLLHPWNFPGKSIGVGCHFLLQCMKVKSESEVAQSCPTLCDAVDCSLPGSSIHGIFQARVLEWVAIAFSDLLHKQS